MGEGWKRAVAATKATRKKPKKPKGNVVAVKTRQTKANAWMPEECHVRLEGEPDSKGGRFLMVCGWSIEADKNGWLVERLKRCLPKLVQQWEEDYGKGWRLEVR